MDSATDFAAAGATVFVPPCRAGEPVFFRTRTLPTPRWNGVRFGHRDGNSGKPGLQVLSNRFGHAHTGICAATCALVARREAMKAPHPVGFGHRGATARDVGREVSGAG